MLYQHSSFHVNTLEITIHSSSVKADLSLWSVTIFFICSISFFVFFHRTVPRIHNLLFHSLPPCIIPFSALAYCFNQSHHTTFHKLHCYTNPSHPVLFQQRTARWHSIRVSGLRHQKLVFNPDNGCSLHRAWTFSL